MLPSPMKKTLPFGAILLIARTLGIASGHGKRHRNFTSLQMFQPTLRSFSGGCFLCNMPSQEF